MVYVFHVLTAIIDYCIEDEDVCWEIDNDPEIEEDSEEYYEAIHNKVAEIKSELPQHLELEIECEEDDLDDMVCEAVSEETGWLVNSVSYDVLDQELSKLF
jgi:hypothetical protein